MTSNTTTRTTRIAAASVVVAVALTLTAGFAPTQNASAAQIRGSFRSRLAAATTVASVTASTEAPLAKTVRTVTRATTAIRTAPVVSSTGTTRKAGTATTATTTRTTATVTTASGDETARARSILASYISKYPALAGTTVSFGDAAGHQAICYYKSGRIVISPTHTASLERIIGHEIWHVLDWRDNGVIDWGENVPPK